MTKPKKHCSTGSYWLEYQVQLYAQTGRRARERLQQDFIANSYLPIVGREL